VKTKLVGLALATVIVIGGTYVARAATGGSASGAASSVIGLADAPNDAPGGSDLPDVERLIRDFEQDVRQHPNSTGLSFLGGLYLQRARLTGDVDTFEQARTALAAALRMAPTDEETLGREATLRFTTHDFPGALTVANGVLASDPKAYGLMAVRGDALVELGRYDDAGATYDALARAVPDTSAVDVRRSHLAFLEGRDADAWRLAVAAEHEAVQAGVFGAALAYYRTAPAQLALDSGRYAVAERYARAALSAAPDYYAAIAMLGKVRAAQGHIDEAIRLYERAVAIVPQPDYLAALGDLYTLRGEHAKADVEYGTVQVIGTLAQINRQVYNRLVAVFDADHDRNHVDAVTLTARELTVRKDVYGWDAYAWALLKAGRVGEARAASDHALALGTRDPKLLYHAGMIAKAQGDRPRARDLLHRALSISPNFDPFQVPIAHRALRAVE
jgi:tetratricopeptide (TPR) repeat protein